MAQLPPTLRRGSRGDAVKGLQNAVRVRSHDFGPVDGIFGPATENAVKQFQRDAGLDDDGIVGSMTWGALCVHLVDRGHTLSGIAHERVGDANRWPEIHELNGELISDPDKIFPGQVFTLPHDAC